jgi:hypothetical protein
MASLLSRRSLLAGCAALAASLLENRMAKAENLAGLTHGIAG